MYKKIISSLTILGLLTLAGCNTMTKEEKYDTMSDKELYDEGLKKTKAKYYKDGAEYFEALEARYPFGDYADKAKLAEIYAYYMDDDYPSALAASERFIRVEPRHPYVDYAYYMKGLAHFSESLGNLSKYLPMDRAERDVSATKEAFSAFDNLINRFPYSQYTPDAKKRILYLRNVIALNELEGARFYLNRGAYVAAVDRASFIITHFQQSPAIEEALFIQAMAYKELGLTDLSLDIKSVLRLNYPKSNFLKALA